MTKEEALQLIQIELDEMNSPYEKSVPERLKDIRVVVNLLAVIVLSETNKINQPRVQKHPPETTQ